MRFFFAGARGMPLLPGSALVRGEGQGCKTIVSLDCLPGGFRFQYRNLRYEWLDGLLPADEGIRTAAFSPDMIKAVAAFDARLFPCRREAFWREWLTLPEMTRRVVFDGTRLVGCGVRRRCVKGYKIGPLFAVGPDCAGALLRDLLDDVAAGEPVYLDVPEINAPAVALAESLGMKPCFGTARMYRGAVPERSLDNLFGVASFELG